MHDIVYAVTTAIQQKSQATRAAYLEKIESAASGDEQRSIMGCSNLAHGIAACSAADKAAIQAPGGINIGIVTAYNDMLSAHKPYETYPELIRQTAQKMGGTAQVAGGVPAMCDGVTQGRDGMDLSLFSRDVIALSTALALSHDMFDATVCLGICDKIVPGLLMGALSFGHLPTIFIPAGPMPSGLPNKEKNAVRESYAAGEVGRDELIAAESASYHSPGTCTFYGTANSNQMLVELMGLQLPGGSFVNPDTPLRTELTREAIRTLFRSQTNQATQPLGLIINEKTIVNGMVGLLATGGSTNHTMHLVAIAKAAGIQIDWEDFSTLSSVIPLLAQVYPNGSADINDFREAGGLGFVVRELLNAGLMHEDVPTVVGHGLSQYTQQPELQENGLDWQEVASIPGDRSILREASDPFQHEGGLQLVAGNIGRAIVKTSAVAEEHRTITAPARVFQSQADFTKAFEDGQLETDVVVVVPNQGPQANGMPELHKLTPYLGVLQNKKYKVALVTDGRMSGASGKVLSAIQVTPEAREGGLIGKIQDGDIITIDADRGVLEVAGEVERRNAQPAPTDSTSGVGRELFEVFRKSVSSAESGASIF